MWNWTRRGDDSERSSPLSNEKKIDEKGGCENCGKCGQEKWREDFPIEWAQDNYITRRDFTRFLIFTSGATALGNGFFVLSNAIQKMQPAPEPVKVAEVGELPVGGVKVFHYPGEHDLALLIHLKQDQYVAYRQRCTHLSCPVLYNAETGQLDCPCHHGIFEAETGRVLSGPPPRPLPQITLAVRDNNIWAEGIRGDHPADNSPGRSSAGLYDACTDGPTEERA